MDFNIFEKYFKNSNRTNSFPTFQDVDDPGNRRDDIFESSFHSPDEIFNQMEDVFNQMFSSSFGVIGFPKLGEVMPSAPDPRSLMLKDSDEGNCSCLSVKESENSDQLAYSSEVFPKHQSFSYSKFSSIKTMHLPDGTVEEHRTFVDSDGKKTTKVRRTIGDTSHEIITKSDKQGLKEKEENFLNMDEKELPDFEKAWNKIGSNRSPQIDFTPLNYSDSKSLNHPDSKSLNHSDSKPFYFSFLKKIFG